MINGGVTVSFVNPTDTLTLTSGGLLTGADNNAKAIGTAAVPGQLTAGAAQSELFVHSGTNTLTINSKIVDNGVSGGLNLVADGMAGGGALTLAAPNSYRGATYFNGLNVTLNSASGPAIPGALIITGGVSTTDSTIATTTLWAADQIATTSNVTLRGGGVLSLNGFSNTINNLVLENTSGDLTGIGGTLNTGAGVLTVAGTIATTLNTNPFTIPQLNGFVNLTSATPTLSVVANSVAPLEAGLSLSAQLTFSSPATPLTVTGGGVIALNAQENFSNQINVTGAGTTLTFGPAAATTGGAAPYVSVG